MKERSDGVVECRGVGAEHQFALGKSVLCLALCAMLLALCVPAEAQQQVKVHKIGWLSPGSAASANIGLFLREFRKLGYVEGENIAIEYRFAEGSLSGCLTSRPSWFD